jgi:NADH-quinone oxidoreductase subunit N
MPLLLPDGALGWPIAVAVVSAALSVLGSVAACRQAPLCKRVAYLSAAQGGFLVASVAAVAHSNDGLPALLFSCVILGVASMVAFAVVVSLDVDRARSSPQNSAPLDASRPILVVLLVLAMFSLAGVPPLPGFVAKVTIIEACVDAGYAWLLPIGILATVLSCAACVRTVRELSRAGLVERESSLRQGVARIAVPVGLLVVAGAVLVDPLLALAQNAPALGG